VGLQLTTATRAGFLIQATALLTPLLASFSGQKPSRNVWIGCMIALAGCLCIAADASAVDADDAAAFSLAGDAAILSSAFFFSLATVRLGTYARAIPAVELAAAKSLVLGGIAVGTFGVAAAALAAEGAPLSDLWPGYDNPLSWGIMIWSALGPGAAAAFLHAKGQSVVPPADAQVIFSTTPLWSVAFAFLLLGGEPLSSYTVAGGAAVVAAGVVASRKEEGADDKNGKQA
jgi:drug/metabolite transporter (DMT)-like permease